jgi:hypothetical protein
MYIGSGTFGFIEMHQQLRLRKFKVSGKKKKEEDLLD